MACLDQWPPLLKGGSEEMSGRCHEGGYTLEDECGVVLPRRRLRIPGTPSLAPDGGPRFKVLGSSDG
eukprot:601511-Alexandrium_andersonii.AAC.1